MNNCSIKNAIGNTPMVLLSESPKIYGKLEGQNLYGSAKDRAALYIIQYLLDKNIINQSTEIVESSSGNFAIGIAGVCKSFGLKFTCVIDPLLNETNKTILKQLGANLVIVSKPDENNNYLKSRLSKVKEIIENNSNTYWINQYDNPLIPNAYKALGEEIVKQLDKIDYIFVPVSTCGTIAGISQFIKSYNSKIKIIGVDLDCSNIFYPAKTKQHIPGMGLFRQPGNLVNAKIDDVVIVSEIDCIKACKSLLNIGIFVGASSGGTYTAIKTYLPNIKPNDVVVAICPDRGERYVKTVFCDEWCKKTYGDYFDT